MTITGNRSASRKYAENYSMLLKLLREQLKSFKNVITHAPWGEYGHAEHVQVYRAVKLLQEELGFDIWCPNYCSQFTFDFMATYINGCEKEYFSFNVDEDLVIKLRELYIKNGCWTWFDNWKWFNEEFFINDSWFYSKRAGSSASHYCPVNVIKMPTQGPVNPIKKMFRHFMPT